MFIKKTKILMFQPDYNKKKNIIKIQKKLDKNYRKFGF